MASLNKHVKSTNLVSNEAVMKGEAPHAVVSTKIMGTAELPKNMVSS